MTYKEAISVVSNTLNSISKDTWIPKRYILTILKDVSTYLVSQKLRDKSLFRETDLFRWIKCFELEEVDIIKCPIVEFRTCNQLMKSKKKLPKIVGSRFGEGILIVQSIDGSKVFNQTSLLSFSNKQKLPNFDKFKGSFYYVDDYLYIPDSSIEVVDLLVLTMDEDYDDCSGCKDNECEDILDRELPVPDKLSQVVIKETISQVAMRFQVPKDENPNLDSNIKTQTIQ